MGYLHSDPGVGQHLFRSETEFSSDHSDGRTSVFQQTDLGGSRKDHIVVHLYRYIGLLLTKLQRQPPFPVLIRTGDVDQR